MARRANPELRESADPDPLPTGAKMIDSPYGPLPLVDDVGPEPEPTEAETEQEPETEERDKGAAGADERRSRREPATEEASPEAKSRRQRAAERGQRKPPKASDLTESPEFREWQATKDRELAEERRKRVEAERRIEDQLREQQRVQLEQLRARRSQSFDDSERQQIDEQIASIRAYDLHRQWKEWDRHMATRMREEGVDAEDPRFQKEYMGQEGAIQFEKDLAEAARDKARRDAKALEERIASIDNEIERRVAQAMQKAGLNYADTAEPAAEAEDDAEVLARDVAALQEGRLPPEAFTKKYGRR